MLSPQLIRENPDAVRKALAADRPIDLAACGVSAPVSDDVRQLALATIRLLCAIAVHKRRRNHT